ncbi:vWA domain-containing protein [Chryseolinea lacunae]|uniref:VWA domain-containing protein n=1 Tax=Chryseolinea lacunae TaxID=2801331 RepID=A0ABS1KWX8_9BACT|nr:vWA domain-containing protein [Chryseolinea lacunae]MBL0743840.1 VWA domain-containing protein [Chryseolinea lacunae]
MHHLSAITRLLKGTAFALILLLCADCKPASSQPNPAHQDPSPAKRQKIMLALLLDTSNSMDGLIEQAKSQLWKIVNELAAAKCTDGTPPEISIALYEYGNDNLSSYEGYIRQVSPLTNDLDALSAKLFALSTRGGAEFCGYVIRTSLEQLDWSAANNDLRMIFIAGNEPFNQGNVPYNTACALAKEKDVVVNTIFCGSFIEGVQTDWKRGADLANGTYMSIEQDRRTVYIATPYDDQISYKNEELNKTYVYYGHSGKSKKDAQVQEDKNAVHYGKENMVERTISKSSHAYSNSSWDMVDAAKSNAKVVTELKTEDLPDEMKSMTLEQRQAYVKQKADERTKIQKEIQTLNASRQKYIDTHTSEKDKAASLDVAMINALKERGKTKNLTWK